MANTASHSRGNRWLTTECQLVHLHEHRRALRPVQSKPQGCALPVCSTLFRQAKGDKIVKSGGSLRVVLLLGEGRHR